MKKILNGKLYDTDTARLIADVPHTNITGSEGACEQRLYLKKNGEFFLWLSGARSEIVSNMALDNGVHDRERHFYPISYEQARKWAESEMSADEWLELFEPEEDDSTSQLALRISTTAYNKLKRAAQVEGKSLRQKIEELINAKAD